MQRRAVIGGGALAAMAALAGAFVIWRRGRAPALPDPRPPVDAAALAAAQAPLTPPDGPMRVYHLGHSLVGRDMPAMLAQLAGHDHASQLGWGTPLRAHWEDRVPITGFETENAHPHFRPARAALASGAYDAVVLTEMVELRDAIRWHASPHYLANWAQAAHQGNPRARLYLYETWHRLDDPAGWLARVDADLPALWQGEVLQGALAWGAPPIHLIPGGQVLAAAVRAAESGALPGLTDRAQFFGRNPDGAPDQIHLGDIGNYLIALVHYAVLYHRSPEGLPATVSRADGTPVQIDPATADALQRLVWQVVRATPGTGVAA
ncbi:hypothetical protein [Gemmobacter nectariphilus]|uniref:hypothetical protein n=1 Tax=Gemmobacter nectariphilus TaxID=220343 RepID=UPI0004824F47|nr:hypothetical protein [Gemmobacter nectariphilus]